MFLPYLDYEPKSIFITLGAFLFGPVEGVVMSVVVCLLEMVTISTTGWVGMVMNALAAICFILPVSLMFHRKRTLGSVLSGLLISVLLTTGMMLLWNYLITPFFTPVSRSAVADLLLPAFLPFNLVKCAINAAFVFLLYQPVIAGLSKARLLPPPKGTDRRKRDLKIVVLLLVSLAIVSAILLFLAYRKII